MQTNRKIVSGNILLIFVVFVAAVLRFNQLGSNPPSLTWDEAAWGYNAYSIGIDGRDEFGRFLPLDYLESFGDFKPPVYAYLAVIPVKIFGLNEFSTRFPSAFFGTLTVLVTYFLTKKSLGDTKLKTNIGKLVLDVPIVSAFILAVSPWHIMLSRAAFEANIATFFIALGVWLFIVSIQHNRKFLILSVASFVFSIYTFNSARVVAPLLLVILAVLHMRKLLADNKLLIISILVGLVMVLPTAKFLFSKQASLRYKEVNIFSDLDLIKVSNQEIANDHDAVWSKLIHNRRIVYGREFLRHYFDNLSPDFLFIRGDENPKFSTQDVGQMYLLDLPFLIIGVLFLVRKKYKNWWFIPLWLVVGIIPAAFARETPHALRIEGSLPTWQILSGLGFVTILNFLKRYKNIIVTVIVLIYSFNIVYFLHGYYVHYSEQFSLEWQYGYKESISYAKSVESDYEKIYFTNLLGRPYIYTLFYTKYNPQNFRENARVSRDDFGFVHVMSFGKYNFPENLPQDSVHKVLYIENAKNIPKSAKTLKTFYLMNGKPILVAYTL